MASTAHYVLNFCYNFHIAVIEYLYPGHRAVPLQTFTARHSNRKLCSCGFVNLFYAMRPGNYQIR